MALGDKQSDVNAQMASKRGDVAPQTGESAVGVSAPQKALRRLQGRLAARQAPRRLRRPLQGVVDGPGRPVGRQTRVTRARTSGRCEASLRTSDGWQAPKPKRGA